MPPVSLDVTGAANGSFVSQITRQLLNDYINPHIPVGLATALKLDDFGPSGFGAERAIMTLSITAEYGRDRVFVQPIEYNFNDVNSAVEACIKGARYLVDQVNRTLDVADDMARSIAEILRVRGDVERTYKEAVDELEALERELD